MEVCSPNVLVIHEKTEREEVTSLDLTEVEAEAISRLPPITCSRYEGKSLSEIYVFHCDRYCCIPNSNIVKYLIALQEQNKPLEIVDCSKNYVGAVGLLPLLELVDISSQVHTVILAGQKLTDRSVEAISEILGDHKGITYMDLSNNPIGVQGARTLQEMVASRSNRVRTVLLSGTQIPEEWETAIHEILKKVRKSPVEF
jgi:Ran GTPase-activating protein (RanGAP) involved in mRNA processing and transport